MNRLYGFLFALIVFFSVSGQVWAAEPHPPEEPDGTLHEMQSRYEALSDAERSAIRRQTDRVTFQLLKLIEKYEKYGIIDAEQSDILAEKITGMNRSARENGQLFPGIPRRLEPVESGEGW